MADDLWRLLAKLAGVVESGYSPQALGSLVSQIEAATARLEAGNKTANAKAIQAMRDGLARAIEKDDETGIRFYRSFLERQGVDPDEPMTAGGSSTEALVSDALVIGVQVAPEMHAALWKRAEREGTSVSDVVRDAVEAYL